MKCLMVMEQQRMDSLMAVEDHHHCLWQVELPQMPQEVHPLMGLFCKGPDVQIPLEVLGDDGAQETERLSADLGSYRVMGAWAGALSAQSLMSRSIPTILRPLSSNSFWLNTLKTVEMFTIKTSLHSIQFFT